MIEFSLLAEIKAKSWLEPSGYRTYLSQKVSLCVLLVVSLVENEHRYVGQLALRGINCFLAPSHLGTCFGLNLRRLNQLSGEW